MLYDWQGCDLAVRFTLEINSSMQDVNQEVRNSYYGIHSRLFHSSLRYL